MTLGSKIKNARKQKNMTQTALCGDRITRNMLSAIECDKACPSLETLAYLAEGLSLPIGYLLGEGDDLFYYEKKEVIGKLRTAYSEKKYEDAIKIAESLPGCDDELALILANSHFELARRAVLVGSLASGKRHLDASLSFSEKTVYDTVRIESLSLLYSSLIENIQAPLLEFDSELFEKHVNELTEYDFYKYVTQDTAYRYKNPLFSKHIAAKEYIKRRNYAAALNLLKEIEAERTPETYNAYLIFSVYADMENCYKQLADFENAYRYASKRISIIEGFKL